MRVAFRLILIIATLAPPVVAFVALVGRSWHPTGDLAIIDLRSRDLFTVHTPLTGLYSRRGWNHPGPLMFWLLGGLSGIAGHVAWAVRVSGAVAQAAALAWLAVATARHSTRMLFAAATVTGLTFLGVGANVFRQPWNPYLPVPFLVAFVFFACLVAAGEFRHLIGMATVGSIIVETHIGFLPLVVAGFAWAAGCVMWDWRQRRAPPAQWRSTVIIAAAISAVVWLPPFIGAVIDTPGSLRRVVRYFTHGGQPAVGLHDAVGILASEFRFVPPWLGGHDHVAAFSGYAVTSNPAWLLIPVALLVAAALAARRTRARDDMRMIGLAALLLVVSVLAISRADVPHAYDFAWRPVVAAFTVVVSAWSIARVVAPAVPRRVGLAVSAALVALVAWCAGVRAVSTTDPGSDRFLASRDTALAAVFGQLRQAGLPTSEVLVRPYGSSLPGLFDGTIDELDRAGVEVRIDSTSARVFGSQRVGSPQRSVAVWWVTEQGSYVPALTTLPGARVIASTTPLPASQDRELTGMQLRLRQQLDAAGRADLGADVDSPFIAGFAAPVNGVDHALADRVAALNTRVERTPAGCRCTIVSVGGAGRFRNPPLVPLPIG